jgi:pimeloyl-ACP methyl ester carboxylesterase
MNVRRVVLLATIALAAATIPTAPAHARFTKIASFPVTFQVQNVNRSKAPCAADGASYRIRGFITGPKAKLPRASRARKRSVTLYLHGLGFGQWFWYPTGAGASTTIPRRFDYALNQAAAGHVSVTIDRLGYDASDHPDGNQICLGGQADIAHQVVQQLRAGTYSVAGRKPVRFKRVALAGHSIGAEIAMIEAYSFRDVDALIDASFSFQNLPRAQIAFGPTRDSCLAGGQPAEPGTPSGYAYFGQPAASDYLSIMFHSAPRSVTDAAVPLRNRDPCGDIASIIPALLQQAPNVANVRVPVLVICGTKDALYAVLGCRMQADRFKRSRSVTAEAVRNAGHAIALERPAAAFRRRVSRWLARRGF